MKTLKQKSLDSLLLKYLEDARSIDLWKLIAKEWLQQKHDDSAHSYEPQFIINMFIDSLLEELKE